MLKKIKKSKINRFVSIILLTLASFIIILTVCDNAILSIKNSRAAAIEDVKKRDFATVWMSILNYMEDAEKQTSGVATNIENDIKATFDLQDLQYKLDSGDKEARTKLSEIFRKNIDEVYVGDVNNNRNSIIILEGYDSIVEDLFVDPESREEGAVIKNPSSPTLSQYQNTTYNKELFTSAVRKIRTHTDKIIAIEPYNYIKGEHEKIPEMNYHNLERVYINEGVQGLRNYQFLVPVYITDSGDIFGQKDIENGVPQENHKFIVIQTFNIYDQIMFNSPEFGDDDYIGRINTRYDRILNSLYIMGIIICTLIVFIIVYFFSLYNILITKEYENIYNSKTKDKNT